MSKVEWLEGNKLKVDVPKRPKKLTGTRFAAVLGKNRWTTPFNVWCAVTRTYEEPFVDTVYTKAGKVIEPKQAAYIAELFFWTKLQTPTDVFGEDYFHSTYGDFFRDRTVFGGMWDYLFVDKHGNPITVLEMKTTKRVEDWADDIPEYYALQAALYAYLLGVDDVMMVCSFLDDEDYEHPENYVCSPNNTITREFKLSSRYPNFRRDYIDPAAEWWDNHVLTGISPVYDSKLDADIIKELRTNNVNPETDVLALVHEAESLKEKLAAHAKEVEDDEKRLKSLLAQIKEAAIEQFRPGDKTVSLMGERYSATVALSQKTSIDKDALKRDGLLEKYTTSNDVYTLSLKPRKEG